MSYLRFDEFKEHFPRLYAKCFDFTVPAGWFDIVDALSGKLEALGVECQQAKEKFGALRYYTGPANEEAIALIADAESRSMYTCQVCGQPGEANAYQGWMRTLCREHCR